MKHTEALEPLKKYWGYPAFRGFQEPIIDHILDGKDTIGLLPTGGGKSICYQIPGLCLPGLTLVISPLVALMADQHNGLVRRGIKSYHFKGSYTPRELDEAFRNLRYGGYKFAFFAPERLHNELFTEYIRNADISLIAIDEAHCISQWGFDFRPSYLNIHKLRELLPDIPVLALTASATPRVKSDLATQLRMADARVFEGSVRRPNLHLHVKFAPNKERQLFRLLPKLEGTGIIYAKTRKNCERLAALLQEEGYTAHYFHAGLSDQDKAAFQADWIANRVKVMVATTAFGMGIDKSDVGWVLHWDAPDTLEGYYQEVGRGGRAGQVSVSYLLFHQFDVSRLQRALDELPDPKAVVNFYNAFCSHFQIGVGTGLGESVRFSVVELAQRHRLAVGTLLDYIRLLQHRGYWQFIESSALYPTLHFTSTPADWNTLDAQDREWLISLLRLYPYAQHQEVRIKSAPLAAHFLMNEDQLTATLLRYQQRGLVEFTPEASGSAVVFLEPRPAPKHVSLPKSFVDSWIESKRERTRGMMDFLQDEGCLFQHIERYFGQDPGPACGTCSSCTRNHYPDPQEVTKRLQNGQTLDDIWFDLNCTPDDLREN